MRIVMDLPIMQSSRFACDPSSLCAPEVSRNWARGEMGEMFPAFPLVQLARRASSLKRSSNHQSVPWDHISRAQRNLVLKELMWRRMAGGWQSVIFATGTSACKGLIFLEPNTVLYWKQC